MDVYEDAGNAVTRLDTMRCWLQVLVVFVEVVQYSRT